jgi:hypothetical protein
MKYHPTLDTFGIALSLLDRNDETRFRSSYGRAAVKTRNFPTRVERRRLRALMPKSSKIEPDVSELRSVRTKIKRVKTRR